VRCHVWYVYVHARVRVERMCLEAETRAALREQQSLPMRQSAVSADATRHEAIASP
jgi:hypothetical protein